jgi:hypothetical protein
MTKVLSESNSPLVQEDSKPYFIPLDEESIVDFINNKSDNVKALKDQYNFEEGEFLGINKNNKMIYFKEGNDILAAYLEDYIQKDLDHYLGNI